MAIKANRFALFNDSIQIPIVRILCAVFVFLLMPIVQSSPTIAAVGNVTISGYITQDGSGNFISPAPHRTINYCEPGGTCWSGTSRDFGGNLDVPSILANSNNSVSIGNVYLNNCAIGGAAGSFSAAVNARTGYFELTAPAGCTGEFGFSLTPYANPRGDWPTKVIEYAGSTASYTVPSSNFTLNIALPTIETATVTAVDTSGVAITNAVVDIDRQNTTWPSFSLSLPGGRSLTATQAPNSYWLGGSCTTGSSGCQFIVPSNSITAFTASSNLGFGVTATKTKSVTVVTSDVSTSFTFEPFTASATTISCYITQDGS